MKKCWKIFDAAGIDVLVHWSFLLLPIAITLSTMMTGGGLLAAFGYVMFVLALFVCVLLHELGHAFMARHYGIATHDITLLPIGGLARLERIPEMPQQELAIALAGPVVNVVIALSLLTGMWLSGGAPLVLAASLTTHSFATHMLWANVILATFNLLPAFPLDGGRVLRALLAMRMPHSNATEIAARIGQAIAVLLALGGVYASWMLTVVGFFIFILAHREAEESRRKARLAGLRVLDLMSDQASAVRAEAQLQNVVDCLLRSRQSHFPVVSGRQFVGMLSTHDALVAIADGAGTKCVSEIMDTDAPSVVEHQEVALALTHMLETGCSIMPVIRDGELVGLLSTQGVNN